MGRFSIAALLMCLGSPAVAGLEVKFVDSAPKDRFTLTNFGTCELLSAAVTIDLSGSPYGLIFDVTSAGAGVQVFQPFELTSGAEYLESQPVVRDGDNQVTLDLAGLPAGETVSFTIDVDDTANSREITVSGEEIVGASVRVDLPAGPLTSPFDARGLARADFSACLS
ncbi:MAG: aggregation factor core [Pseudomonadota bacterium]